MIRLQRITTADTDLYSYMEKLMTQSFPSEEYRELTNVRFVCMDARNITDVFAPGEVGKIYLNFSDPWPKARHAKRRLTSRSPGAL